MAEGRDKFGTYHTLTGYEGTGKCFWCGGDFPDKRLRRFCSEQCQYAYWRHFIWPYASSWCIERAGHKCECGSTYKLEVHHIVPLNGEYRVATRANMPHNLVCLCHDCHVKRHSKTPEEKLEAVKQKHLEILEQQRQAVLNAGQLPMEIGIF